MCHFVSIKPKFYSNDSVKGDLSKLLSPPNSLKIFFEGCDDP